MLLSLVGMSEQYKYGDVFYVKTFVRRLLRRLLRTYGRCLNIVDLYHGPQYLSVLSVNSSPYNGVLHKLYRDFIHYITMIAVSG